MSYGMILKIFPCCLCNLIWYFSFVLSVSALLTVNDDEFWEGVSPVEFGTLPALQDAVTVVGYPIGGDTISVTSGVVSRIEILSYVHGSTELLGLQVPFPPEIIITSNKPLYKDGCCKWSKSIEK